MWPIWTKTPGFQISSKALSQSCYPLCDPKSPVAFVVGNLPRYSTQAMVGLCCFGGFLGYFIYSAVGPDFHRAIDACRKLFERYCKTGCRRSSPLLSSPSRGAAGPIGLDAYHEALGRRARRRQYLWFPAFSSSPCRGTYCILISSRSPIQWLGPFCIRLWVVKAQKNTWIPAFELFS